MEKETKVLEIGVAVIQQYFWLNRNSFLWPLDLTTLLCESIIRQNPFHRAVVPSRGLPPSLDVLVRQPSSGSGGRENEKSRKMAAN